MKESNDKYHFIDSFSLVEDGARSFEDLIVWQKAHSFVLEIYSITKGFPKEELYALTSQLRRAAISIPANIAEGFSRSSKSEKIRFYNISQGSLSEVKYFLILSKELHYSDTSDLLLKAEEISKILDKYIKLIAESKR
jgi:four helix bundle protein